MRLRHAEPYIKAMLTYLDSEKVLFAPTCVCVGWGQVQTIPALSEFNYNGVVSDKCKCSIIN